MLFALFLLFAPLPATVQTHFVRVEETQVCFYASPADVTSEVLFYLPQSYYLTVVDEGPAFYQVTIFDNTDGFYKIAGYVKKSAVSACDETPVAPLYPKETLYALNNTQLCSSPQGGILCSTLKGQPMLYYGTLGEWHYVLFGGEFGYVRASDATLPQIALHPTPLPQKEVPDLPQDEEKPSPAADVPQADATHVALVILFAVPLVTAVVLLFRTDEPKKPRYFDYYDKPH